jgi:hypothetical protein
MEIDVDKLNAKFKPAEQELRDKIYSSVISGLAASGDYKNEKALFDKAFELSVKGVIYMKERQPGKLAKLFNFGG